MFDAISNALGAGKDKLVEASAKAFLNSKIAEFGTITALSLNARAKTASITAELKGEQSPVHVDVDAFEVLQAAGETHIRVLSVRSNREWLTCALRQYLVGRLVKLPNGAAALLS